MAQDQDVRQELLRRIPAVDQLLLRPGIEAWIQRTSRSFVVSEIQEVLQLLRASMLSGAFPHDDHPDPALIESRLGARLQERLRPSLQPVVNATGVILHTNLGRAPLSVAAQQSLSAVSAQYTNLEYDLQAGTRSHRDQLIESALRDLLGCEAATAVNNNAAAVFLILETLAPGKEVVVSRGELIEIGGSFRIPEIMLRSGARLREVGTTNKTHLRDFEAAIGPDTAMILRVHPSNYRVHGFTARPSLQDLAGLAQRHQLPLVEDIGSGCLVDLHRCGIQGEPVAAESIAAGADIICFSADKLLGGPQAGIIAGRRRWIDMIRANPLIRTYRLEKLIYGALGATLASYRTGRAWQEIPVLRMLSLSRAEIRRRSARFLRRIAPELPREVHALLRDGTSVVGGGSCPDVGLATVLVALSSERRPAHEIEQRLRLQDPPIIVRLEEDNLLVDLRTVFPAQEKALLSGLLLALSTQ